MGEILRAVNKDGSAKISVITARDAVEQARQIHHLRPVGTAALGRTLCGASLLGEMLKEEDGTLTIRIRGNGPIAGITAVSDSRGNVRGCVGNPGVDLPLRTRDGKLDVSGAVGTEGLITVSRDIGLREPYVGSTALVSGEIAEDLAAYLTESDQLGSACALGVLVDTDETVKAAGGFLMQLMPFAPEETIAALEENIFMMDQLTTILDEDGPEAVVEQVFKGMEPHITERVNMEYRCYCSRERVLQAVTSLSESDLEQLRSDGREVEVRCQFCDAVYTFPPEEVAAWRHTGENGEE
ncbi:MAG: Hsp33 family molecular chaperone HslO [Oscillospiraceae bacterium]|nr:Hsp33 family molecular chaperone HslO [Oscillospiraceae bacterium]